MVKLKSENLMIQWCKGCGYCVKACPKGALHLGDRINDASYRYVELDEEKCITCGICRLVCPDCVFKFVEEGEA